MLKKISILSLSVLLVTSVAQAGHHHKATAGGGFQGPGAELTTVQATLNMKDDANVRLVGHIEKSLGDEKYMFKDNTGEIIVEIDNDLWQGRTVTPNDSIEINGDVDKEWGDKTKIDVDSLKMLAPLK